MSPLSQMMGYGVHTSLSQGNCGFIGAAEKTLPWFCYAFTCPSPMLWRGMSARTG
ncbi:MAG: hypothetical protein V7K32_07405 [Nostoc sp.]|uniref:hypothetical protein n=1 Tax=Nostoc sp. TaxID=1180 RepID=UPI002FF97CB0